MKLVLLFMMLSVMSCKSQKTEMSDKVTSTNSKSDVVKVERSSNDVSHQDGVIYTETTRGYFFEVKQLGNAIFVTKVRGGKAVEAVLSSNDKKELDNLIADLDLHKMSSLKAPSQLRTHDAAAAAFVKVLNSGSEYKSSSFDAGNPPKELVSLVRKMKELSKLVK